MLYLISVYSISCRPAQIEYELPYKWTELAGCLDVLNITVPYPLLGMGSLTYVEEGTYASMWRIYEQLEIL